MIRPCACLLPLALAALAVAAAHAAPAVVFDARTLDWEERCTVEALQGLVNRTGPRLYLDNGQRFEQQWLDIYAERAGLKYEKVTGLRTLLERFGRETKGVAVYDPMLDASRYVALTLAGVDDLIPVCPAVLAGRSPGMMPSGDWPGVDFTADDPAQVLSWRRAANPTLTLTPGNGLLMQEGNPDPKSPWSFISTGPVTVDLGRYPILEVNVSSVEGPGAGWMIKLTWDRNGDGQISGGEDDLCLPLQNRPGIQRWNIAELGGVRARHTFALVQLHIAGEGAKVLWRGVRFVSPEGQGPVPTAAASLTALGLPVKRDLRGQFAGTIAAYDWALRELMPRCSRRLAHTVNGGMVDGTNTGVCGPMAGFDWHTQNKGFVFNLACTADKKISYGTECGGSPEQAAMYGRILDALIAPAQINGYGDPEDVWCRLLSQHGHYSFHAYSNWSFHSKVPCTTRAFHQKTSFTPANTKPDTQRFYVCFMTSEGDTMKGPIPFFYESWFDPARGKVPVNWGINPLTAQFFPAMLQYYYDTATPDDYFFTGCSGAGYCYPDDMKDLDKFARHTAVACAQADLPHIDVWGASRPDVQERFAALTKPLGLTVNCSPARLKLLSDGTPVAYHELAYWQTDGLNGASWPQVFADPEGRKQAVARIVQRIENIAERNQPPFVILVYGDLHSYARHAQLYQEVAQALDPERYHVARLDEAMAGVRAWARGRVMVGSNGINERLAWAALAGVPTVVPLTLTSGCDAPVTANLSVRAGGQECATTVRLAPREARQVSDLRLTATDEGTSQASVVVRAGGQAQRSEASLTVVPCATKARQAAFAACWSATGLSHRSGSVVTEAGALWGKAWSSPEVSGKSDCIVFGPYAPMPAGRYLAAFRVGLAADTPTDVPPDADLATLDVFAGGYAGTAKVAGQTVVYRRDFPAPGQWRWFAVEGDWAGLPSLMETRVDWHGKARLLIDRIVLFRLN
jgi:hypothetical protein